MTINLNKFRNNKLFVLLALTTIILILSAFYFINYSFRRSASVYVTGFLVKNLNYPNTGIYWVPFWMSEAVGIGDRDFSPFGGINAEVIDKEAMDSQLNGQQVKLLLRLKAIKDRSGLLLYKNKPLSIGSVIELRLSRTTLNFLITDVSNKKPDEKFRKIIINTYFKEIDPWMADYLKVGSEIKNNKGQVLAKVIEKKVDYAKVSGETASGQKVETIDKLKREMYVTIELQVTEKNGYLYFFGIQRIWPNQSLYLPWREGELYHQIIAVNPFRD